MKTKIFMGISFFALALRLYHPLCSCQKSGRSMTSKVKNSSRPRSVTQESTTFTKGEKAA